MKKHRLSRILASISALAMTTCGVPFTTSAETLSKADYNVITDTDISLAMQTSIPRMLWTMKNKPDYLGFECPDNAVVGEKFTIADSEEGIFSDDNSIVYFPVSSNGEIIAIVSLLKNEGEVTTTVGKDFAKELSSALKDSDKVALVSVNNSNIVAINEKNELKIISSDGTINESAIIENIGDLMFEQLKSIDSYTISNAEVYENTMPTENIVNMYSDNVERIRKDYYVNGAEIPAEVLTNDFVNENNSIINIASDSMLYSYNPNAVGMGDYLDEYEIVGQGYEPICWAATVASMLRWEMPNVYAGYTAHDVCDALGHSYSGASASYVDDYLSALLTPYNNNYVPTYEPNTYSQSDICVIINNEDPAYMSAAGASSNSGRHGTALCGYLFFSDNTFAIRIMNPGYNGGTGVFQLSDRAYSSTTFRYPYNSTTYTWDRSVRFYYNHS